MGFDYGSGFGTGFGGFETMFAIVFVQLLSYRNGRTLCITVMQTQVI